MHIYLYLFIDIYRHSRSVVSRTHRDSFILKSALQLLTIRYD